MVRLLQNYHSWYWVYGVKLLNLIGSGKTMENRPGSGEPGDNTLPLVEISIYKFVTYSWRNSWVHKYQSFGCSLLNKTIFIRSISSYDRIPIEMQTLNNWYDEMGGSTNPTYSSDQPRNRDHLNSVAGKGRTFKNPFRHTIHFVGADFEIRIYIFFF